MRMLKALMMHFRGSDLASPGSGNCKPLGVREEVSLLRRPFLLNEQWLVL